MLRKRTSDPAKATRLFHQLGDAGGGRLTRRSFLERSGLAAGGLAGLAALDLRLVRQ